MAKATTTPKKSTKQKPSAQLIEGDKATDLSVEEMPAAQPATMAVIKPQDKAKQEVARFDIARSWIAEKKAAYTDLSIEGVEDKEGQKKVKEAWQEVRNKRLEVAKKHTEIKADYLEITQAIDKEKRELTQLLEEVENPLKEKLDKIEAIKEEEKKKEEREKAQKLQGRVNELLGTGMAFNGSYYAIGATISMDVVTLQNMNDADYSTFLGRVAQENAAIIEAKELKEKKDREEREALEAQKKQQEETQRKLDEQKKQQEDERAAIDKQRKDLLAARTKARGKMLEGLGYIYSYTANVWFFETKDCGGHTLTLNEVETADEAPWDVIYEAINSQIKTLKENQAAKDKEKDEAIEARRIKEDKERAEAEARRVVIANRKADLMAYLGMKEQADGSFKRTFDFEEITPLLMTQSQIESYEPEAWTTELKSLQDYKDDALKMQERLQKEKNAEVEAVRVAALSDRDRVNEYLRNFAEATGKRPQITDKRIKKAWDAFDKVIASAVEDLTLVLDNIK
jgi:hypothetical protein